MSRHDDIEALVHGYAVALDTADRASFERLWSEDAVLEVFQDGPDAPATGRLVVGRNLHAVFERLAAYDRTMHHVTTHLATIHGEEATGSAYCAAHHVSGNEDLVMHIRYDDRYALGPSGWRFAARRVVVLFTERRAVTEGTSSSSPRTP